MLKKMERGQINSDKVTHNIHEEKMKMRREPFISLPNTCQRGSKNENFPGSTKAKRQLSRSLYHKNKACENKLIYGKCYQLLQVYFYLCIEKLQKMQPIMCKVIKVILRNCSSTFPERVAEHDPSPTTNISSKEEKQYITCRNGH